MTNTPLNERVIVFPEPLRGMRGLRVMAVGCAMLAAAGSIAWFFLGEREPAFVGRAPGAVFARPAESRPPLRSAVGLALLDTAIADYEAGSPDSAGASLRAALRLRGADSLDARDNARALMYLAAAEFQRGRRDSAIVVLRRLLQAHPRVQPDSARFPASLVALYASVRASLNGVARIRTTDGGVELVIVAFSAHRLGVGVETRSGTPILELFDGVVRDSVTVGWDGVRADGTVAPPGAYNLVLIAFNDRGAIERAVRFPVTMEASTPERSGRPRAVDSALAGARP